MHLRLGEILVQEGSCRPDVVEEALKHQAIFGGRLGTNLLELGAISEEVLAFALGKRTGAPALYGDLPVDPKAIRLLGRRLAERWDVVPFLLADRRLAVLARDPLDLQMLDEVAFATGKRVHAFVVPEARLWRTLNRAYGVDREHRGADMGRRALTPPPMPATPREEEAPGDLIDESDFQGLYGAMAGMGPAATPAPGALEAVTPLPAPPQGPAPAPGEVPPLTLEVLSELTARPGHQPPLSLELPELLSSRPSAPEAAEPSALSFADAVRFLEGVGDRETIARTVLRYARSRFARAVLLTVRRGEVHGWAGLGGGLTADAVLRLRLPLGVPGAVDTVVATRAPFVGPLQKTWSNIRLLKGLGGGVPGSALLVPVLALGRVVNVLYVDAGRGKLVDASDLGELLILAARISKSYDDLARRAV
ncbi:MAG: general secretion pathway protein GspE [Anaeromyxobacteraceae bacterium]|nr:general secretion pathway protein GspE [Anaeromyxobacteraceae bacterium]